MLYMGTLLYVLLISVHVYRFTMIKRAVYSILEEGKEGNSWKERENLGGRVTNDIAIRFDDIVTDLV